VWLVDGDLLVLRGGLLSDSGRPPGLRAGRLSDQSEAGDSSLTDTRTAKDGPPAVNTWTFQDKGRFLDSTANRDSSALNEWTAGDSRSGSLASSIGSQTVSSVSSLAHSTAGTGGRGTTSHRVSWPGTTADSQNDRPATAGSKDSQVGFSSAQQDSQASTSSAQQDSQASKKGVQQDQASTFRDSDNRASVAIWTTENDQASTRRGRDSRASTAAWTSQDHQENFDIVLYRPEDSQVCTYALQLPSQI
jgi:hypothetical protein